MSFIEELKWRGLLDEMTPGLEEELQKGTIVGYIGYDPTAPSLTIGNLVTVMLLKHLQLAGHKPIVLLGGATGRIGDPSGKDAERQLLSYEKLQEHIDRQREQFGKLLDFSGENAAVMLNNYSFYKNMSVFDFLRDIGKNITVNYMLSKESVKNRMETGISFTEFSYQLIQGYDFQHLFEHHNCVLQMGGSDQWGNITTGTEFIRKAGGKGYGLVCPLLTKADGKKFGKSEKGNVWLDGEMTTPYQFYQFWLNVTDEDLSKLLRIFSLRSREEIEALEAEHADNPRALKQLLAEEMTERLHGKEGLSAAQKTTEIVFSKKLKPEFLQAITAEEFEMLRDELDSFAVAQDQLDGGIKVDELLEKQHKSLQSKSDVRRAIKGQALAVNGQKVSDSNLQISEEHLIHGKYALWQNGRKNKFLMVVE